MSFPFVVKTNEYEGPLDALVTLIEKRKLLINDISLSEVTESYIGYLNSLENKTIDNLSDFISIAATLLLVKSKSLLPQMDLSYEEELSIDELKERLSHYEQVRAYAQTVYERWGTSYIYHAGERPKECIFYPGKDMNKESLRNSVQQILARIPTKEVKPEVRVRRVVSLEEVISKIRTRAQGYFRISFKDFIGSEQEKPLVIVNFLAMLELIKQGELLANQEKHFDDIVIESQAIVTPRYF